jgi:hypothetical protein
MTSSRRIINAFRTPHLLYTVINNINRQKKFIQQHIEPEIALAKQINDGSIDNADCKKITGYYGLAVPAILGEAFCALRGQKMTHRERLASTCQGATTGLFDDFFDKQNLSADALKNFIEKPQELKGENANQQLFLNLYTTGLENLPDPQHTLSWVYRVYKAQVESRKQALPGLDQDEIKRITLEKGAVSLLLYRTAFANTIDQAEADMLYKLGGLMQLGNDIFDVYEDREQGIHTLVTTAKNIQKLRGLFLSLLKEAQAAAYASNYDPRNIKKFLDIISIGIFSRCMVCLDHLEKNESKTGNVFTPVAYSRKELICDMDTAGNKWRSVKYHIKTECR